MTDWSDRISPEEAAERIRNGEPMPPVAEPGPGEKAWAVVHVQGLDADAQVVHEIHLVPEGDVVEHDHNSSCECRPTKSGAITFKHLPLDPHWTKPEALGA